MLNKLTIKFLTTNKIVKGSFRGFITALNKDIIVLGNKESSALFCFDNVVEVSEIDIEEIAESSGQVTAEYYTPKTKQEAYSLLTKLYAKYKNGKVIETEKFETEVTYSFKLIEGAFEASNISYYSSTNENFSNDWSTANIKKVNKVYKKVAYKEFLPTVTKSKKIIEYLNKNLNKNTSSNWKQKYLGELK